MPWDLTGNAGTNPNINFVGTADQQPLVIRTNNKEALRVDQNGNIGAGTQNPATKVEIVGNWDGQEGALRLTGDKPTVKFAGAQNTWMLHLGSDGGGSLEIFKQGASPTSWNNIMTLTPSGSVGIGTNAPNSKLEIVGSDGLQIVGYQPYLTLNDSSNQKYALAQVQNANGDIFFHTFSTIKLHGDAAMVIKDGSGNVGIGTPSPSAKLAVVGDVTVTGDIKLTGADCAEQFDAGGVHQLGPGTVVVIDQNGAMRESREAYDTRVAGVVSGAGEYSPGIVLDRQQSQEGKVLVALVGKVYCKVDARYSPIEVGDLLTTSPTPGCAMKAGDPFKAFGSVVGKALHPLRSGQGLLPILIALQ